ncbi:MAG: hypothetical protein L3J69_02810 [Desulfobacula sp.]|nr:hypothetical protein [Desulfobacula sp.]
MKNIFFRFKSGSCVHAIRIKILELCLVILALIIPFILIEDTFAIDKQALNEIGPLPDFCKYTADSYFKGKSIFSVLETIDKTKNKNKAYKKLYKYYKKFGTDMIHMHHYCRGMTKYNNAFECSTEQCRKQKIESAIREMEYLLKNTKKKLWPVFLHNQGQWFLQLNEPMKAMNVFMKAVKTNPRYVKGYISLYSLFLSLNDETRARNILKLGLKYSPSSKALMKLKAK